MRSYRSLTSGRLSRRGVLALVAAALPFAGIRSVAAQTLNGCGIGFVNGLLQIDPECIVTGPGGPAATAPGHLAPLITDGLDDAPSINSIRTERLGRRRDRRRDKRFDRRDRRDDHSNRRRDKKRLRRERSARRVTCDQFTYQEQAQDWHDRHSLHSRLTENDDGFVCVHALPCEIPDERCAVEQGLINCAFFDSQQEAQHWHEEHLSYSPLKERDDGQVCT